MAKIKDRNYKGDDFNIRSDLLDNAFNHRKCTDVLCGIFFFLFLSGMGAMVGYGYSNGNPGLLLAPIAANGNTGSSVICGYGDAANYPYLYIYDIDSALGPSIFSIANFFDYSTCATACPQVGQPIANMCLDQAECNANGVNATYSSFSLMFYCIPEVDTLTG